MRGKNNMNQNQSIPCIDAPEFINLEPDAINPGISKCEIKVFYLGKNRNGSYINRETAIQMANTLPGCPIVGKFRKEVEDFSDHGEVMHLEDGELEFYSATQPYGFVAPDAQVWFQRFEDTDSFGNKIQRDYLMTEGYLWTSQYEEAMQCIQKGKGQSMELDPETLNGHWATDENQGIDFFIINEATLTKLCILGDDVEPCFEGAAVTAPEISKQFSLSENFAETLFSMMNELKDALQNKGGSDMPEDFTEEVVEETTETVEEPAEEVVEETIEEAGEGEADAADNFTTEEETEVDEGMDSFKCGDDKKNKHEKDDDDDDEEDDDDEDDDKPSANHALEEANARIAALEAELQEFRAYKLEQENLQKDAVINKYHMLSDEDKAPIIAAKDKYSVEEIEAQLALIYVKNNVDFSTLDGSAEETPVEEESAITTFSLDSDVAGPVPAIVDALRQTL